MPRCRDCGCGCPAVAVPTMAIIHAVPVAQPLAEGMTLLSADTRDLTVGPRLRRRAPTAKAVRKHYEAFVGGSPQERLDFITLYVTTWPLLVQRVMEKLHAADKEQRAQQSAQRSRERRPKPTLAELQRQRQRMAELRAHRRAVPALAVAGV